ncbi:hypothetical protein BSG1_14163 [Bacillus sp. SG-1]|nr:hypothetical protein BSG1_14163 [Bacillus sp. SG-1]
MGKQLGFGQCRLRFCERLGRLSAILTVYQRFLDFIGDFWILSAILKFYQRFLKFIGDSTKNGV